MAAVGAVIIAAIELHYAEQRDNFKGATAFELGVVLAFLASTASSLAPLFLTARR